MKNLAVLIAILSSAAANAQQPVRDRINDLKAKTHEIAVRVGSIRSNTQGLDALKMSGQFSNLIDQDLRDQLMAAGREMVENLKERRQELMRFAPQGNCGPGTPCYAFRNELLDFLNTLNDVGNGVLTLDMDNQTDKPLDISFLIGLVEKVPGQFLLPLAMLSKVPESVTSPSNPRPPGRFPQRGPEPAWLVPAPRRDNSIFLQNLSELKLIKEGLPHIRKVHQVNYSCDSIANEGNQILASALILQRVSNGLTIIGTILRAGTKGIGWANLDVGAWGWVHIGSDMTQGIAVGDLLDFVGNCFYNEYSFLSDRVYHCQKVQQQDQIIRQNKHAIEQSLSLIDENNKILKDLDNLAKN